MKKLFMASIILLIATQCFAIEKVKDKELYKDTLGEDEVIIGDEIDSSTFKNKIKFTKWNKEEYLIIDFSSISGNPILGDVDKLKSKDLTNAENFYYTKHNKDIYKFGLIFKEKPSTNIFTFRLIGWENFNFFYQPELTQEEINKGGMRPDDVIGSYAIYHKTKCNYIVGQTNYQTGKFGHIFRPRLIDANNNTVWVDLNITNGIYTLILPQEFLDSAIYPIRINDTFGNTSVGGTAENAITAYLDGTHFTTTSGQAGTLSKISVYGGGRGVIANLVAGIYNNSGTTPSTKLDNGDAVVMDTTITWWDSGGLDQNIVASTKYWLAKTVSANAYFYYDVVSNSGYYRSFNYLPTLPDPFGSGNVGGAYYSIYATYTPDAGGTSIMGVRRIFLGR